MSWHYGLSEAIGNKGGVLMSRASEITLFLILLQASIGFVDATGMFSQSYLDVPDNNATYSITDLNTYYESAEEQSIFDEIQLYAHWAIEVLLIGVKIIGTVIFVLPTLISIFGVPAILATFIQVGIYYVYATFYAQLKSKQGWGFIKEV